MRKGGKGKGGSKSILARPKNRHGKTRWEMLQPPFLTSVRRTLSSIVKEIVLKTYIHRVYGNTSDETLTLFRGFLIRLPLL